MKTKRKKLLRVVLTARDLNMFRFLFRHKVASIDQLKTNFFPNTDIANLRRRLRRLINHGYIEDCATYHCGKMFRLFSLTELGLTTLEKYGLSGVIRRQLKSNSEIHDYILVDIAYYLKNVKAVHEYLTENELQCLDHESNYELEEFIELNSDGYSKVVFGKSEYNVAVEYEHSANRKYKYTRLALKYYLSRYISNVFYFYKSKWIKKAITTFEKENFKNSAPKFYFHKIKDNFHPKEKIVFENWKGQKLELDLPNLL